MAAPRTTGQGDDADLDATVGALEKGVTDVPLSAGADTIDLWQTRLTDAGDPALTRIAATLGELRTLLAAQPVDGAAVGSLLSQLGEQTTGAARSAPPELAGKLAQLGDLLSGEGQRLA